MKGYKQPPRSASWRWRSTGWTFVIVGTLLIILGIFTCPLASVQTIQAAYAFSNTARSTTQGTVQASDQKYNPPECVDSGCAGGDYTCSTTVMFIPLGRSASFTTTDNQCSALAKGTQVEVLYDTNNPSIAKTPRQASADITNAIWGTILWPIIPLYIVVLVFGVLLATRK